MDKGLAIKLPLGDLSTELDAPVSTMNNYTWCGRRESNPHLKLGKLTY